MKRLLCIVAMAALLLASGDALPAGGATSKTILKQVGEQSAKEGPRRLSGSIIKDLGMQNSPQLKGLSQTALDEFESAIATIVDKTKKTRKGPTRSLRITTDELKLAFRAPRTMGRSTPLSSNLPNVLVRLADSREFDAVLMEFARIRISRVAEKKFDARRMRVVIFDLADDSRDSSAEVARLESRLESILDQQNPIRVMESLLLTHQGRVRALRAYRGETIILVGHIREGERGFFRIVNGRKVDVPIEKWVLAGKEAGVSILAVGCKSAKIADVGVDGFVSSTQVLNSLEAVSKARPTTYRDFFGAFTTDDLRLVVDPVRVDLLDGGTPLINKDLIVVGVIVLAGAGGVAAVSGG